VNEGITNSGEAVSVTLEVDGGFAYLPGLNQTFHADSDTLAPEELAQLRALLAKADFFNLSDQPGAPAPGAADLRTYTITASEGGKSHKVRVTEPIQNPHLQALVSHLLTLQRRAR
jgi:hypothetical protein